MIRVDTDSNVIIVEPINSRNDAELIQAYHVLMIRLKRAGIIPKKHVLNNEVSERQSYEMSKKWRWNSSHLDATATTP